MSRCAFTTRLGIAPQVSRRLRIPHRGPVQAIPGFKGSQYERDTNDRDYNEKRYQYATTTYGMGENMHPKTILYPESIEDIKSAVKYARSNKAAIAVRTGGHQYSGASSTSGPNIQLDLSRTFPNDISYHEEGGKHLVRTSVSWDLLSFNAYLGKHGLFIPHGQCCHVHLGGHVQTGGYGQLGRSFGLLGDHVVSLEMVNCNGEHVTITRDDKDLFYAILGGSPGNFGVLTHFTVTAYSDKDYEGSCGLKTVYLYKPETLKNLLNILVEMANDEGFPRNYDYCINVLSSSCKFLDFCPEMDEEMKIFHPELYGKDGVPIWPRMIVVYAQYVPFSKTDTCNLAWFDRIKNSGERFLDNKVTKKSMSELTADWIFRNIREFDFPYMKQTHLTSSKTLVADNFVDWIAQRIGDIVRMGNHCWLSFQIQNFGGKYSQFYNNRNNGTSYSWRDSTLLCTMDCFYNADIPSAKRRAQEWQSTNDSEGIGPKGRFSKQDRRVLWGSYGDPDMSNSWPYYYEDKKKYGKLCEIKRRVDPDNVFTPNAFCVGTPRSSAS